MGRRIDTQHILVAEDNEAMRLLILQLLGLLGATKIDSVANGAAAQAFVKKHKPDILITDYKMEPTTGVEVAEWVRRDPDAPDQEMSIIMTSAYSEPRRVMDARDAGVNEFLVKPINIKRLYSRLRAVLHSKRAFVRSDSYVGPCRRRAADPRFEGPFRRADDVVRQPVEASPEDDSHFMI